MQRLLLPITAGGELHPAPKVSNLMKESVSPSYAFCKQWDSVFSLFFSLF
jgi:hypothetical protein